MSILDGIGDRFSQGLYNAKNHPFQTGIGFLAGGLVPGGGLAASSLFDRYNNDQFAHGQTDAQQQLVQALQQHQAQTNKSIFDKPLDGPLGQFDNAGHGPDMSGPQGFGPTSGWDMSQGQNTGGLLDFLGPAPAQGPGGTFANGGQMQYGQNPQGGSGMGGNAGGGTQGWGSGFAGNFGDHGVGNNMSDPLDGGWTGFGGTDGSSSGAAGGAYQKWLGRSTASHT